MLYTRVHKAARAHLYQNTCIQDNCQCVLLVRMHETKKKECSNICSLLQPKKGTKIHINAK